MASDDAIVVDGLLRAHLIASVKRHLRDAYLSKATCRQETRHTWRDPASDLDGPQPRSTARAQWWRWFAKCALDKPEVPNDTVPIASYGR